MEWMSLLPRPILRALAHRRGRVHTSDLAGIETRLATQAWEVEASCRLLHDAYVGRGIATAHPSGVRVTPHLFLPTTNLFVAVREQTVVGTIALIGDGELGVPLERVFPETVRALRAGGKYFAEIGALAIDPAHRGKGIPYLLYKTFWRTAYEVLGHRQLVISVHPRARALYSALNFQPVARQRAYRGLSDAPAIALVHDMDVTRELGRRGSTDRSAYNLASMACTPLEAAITLPTHSDLTQAVQTQRDLAPYLAAARADVIACLSRTERRSLRGAVPSLRPMLPSLVGPLVAEGT